LAAAMGFTCGPTVWSFVDAPFLHTAETEKLPHGTLLHLQGLARGALQEIVRGLRRAPPSKDFGAVEEATSRPFRASCQKRPLEFRTRGLLAVLASNPPCKGEPLPACISGPWCTFEKEGPKPGQMCIIEIGPLRRGNALRGRCKGPFQREGPLQGPCRGALFFARGRCEGPLRHP